MSRPEVLVVMGVSGSGKSTIAEPVAKRLGWDFQEGDELHPPANIAKMKAGHPLTDADRAPWLTAVRGWIAAELEAGRSGVITCSALKHAYRTRISEGLDGVRFVYLKGDEAEIRERMADRKGHFMPVSLLDSQFDTLEPPGPHEHAIVIDNSQTVEAQVDEIITNVVPPAVADAPGR